MVPVVVTGGCGEFFGVGDTRIMITSLGVLVGINVGVGDAVYMGKGVAVITGAGTKITPIAPIIVSANPLAKLIINHLG